MSSQGRFGILGTCEGKGRGVEHTEGDIEGDDMLQPDGETIHHVRVGRSGAFGLGGQVRDGMGWDGMGGCGIVTKKRRVGLHVPLFIVGAVACFSSTQSVGDSSGTPVTLQSAVAGPG